MGWVVGFELLLVGLVGWVGGFELLLVGLVVGFVGLVFCLNCDFWDVVVDCFFVGLCGVGGFIF